MPLASTYKGAGVKPAGSNESGIPREVQSLPSLVLNSSGAGEPFDRNMVTWLDESTPNPAGLAVVSPSSQLPAGTGERPGG